MTLHFLNEAQTDVLADDCMNGAITPAGSYAREVVSVNKLGDVEGASPEELAALGIVNGIPGEYNSATEEVTTSDWQRDGNGNVIITGQTIAQVLTTQPIDAQVLANQAAAALASAQASALNTIDNEAEGQRLKLITPGSGQAMSYQVKADEAAACLANHTAATPPQAGTYVLLDSEVGVMANIDGTLTADAYQVAVVVDATRQAWLQAEAAINRVRVQAKADVKAAADVAAVNAVLAAIVWPGDVGNA